MNALRNFLYTRTTNYLLQNGNTLLNFTQPTNPPPSTTLTAGNGNINDFVGSEAKRPVTSQPLLIPKSILDTTFHNKQLNRNGTTTSSDSISPNTLRRYRRMTRKVELVYRCKLCNTRNRKLVTETAFTSGVVILQCAGCQINHLIADNVGWFANTRKSFDEVLAEQSGAAVKIIRVNEHGDLI